MTTSYEYQLKPGAKWPTPMVAAVAHQVYEARPSSVSTTDVRRALSCSRGSVQRSFTWLADQEMVDLEVGTGMKESTASARPWLVEYIEEDLPKRSAKPPRGTRTVTLNGAEPSPAPVPDLSAQLLPLIPEASTAGDLEVVAALVTVIGWLSQRKGVQS